MTDEYYELSKFVNRGIQRDQSSLVEKLLADGLVHWYEVENLYPSWPELEEQLADVCAEGETHVSLQPQEIFEWWLVADWFADMLQEKGEPVLRSSYGTWWGRTCTGQAIALDPIIADIYRDVTHSRHS